MTTAVTRYINALFEFFGQFSLFDLVHPDTDQDPGDFCSRAKPEDSPRPSGTYGRGATSVLYSDGGVGGFLCLHPPSPSQGVNIGFADYLPGGVHSSPVSDAGSQTGNCET